MHYRQTIIDAAVAALETAPTLIQDVDGVPTAQVTSTNFFDVPLTPAARVSWVTEDVPEEQLITNSDQVSRVLSLRIQVLVAGNNVQADANGVLEDVERLLPPALEAVADCAYLTAEGQTIEADQDGETSVVEVDYTVQYVTDLGDPATRV